MSSENESSNILRSLNPATLELLGQVSVSTEEEILGKVTNARQAFVEWSRLSLEERLYHLESFRQLLLARKDELAKLITSETGKPLIESYGSEFFGPLETIAWLRGNASSVLNPQTVRLNPIFFSSKTSYNVFEPLGVVAIISPWNYPFSIPVCSMLTALAAGNSVVLKPSPKSPLVGKAIQELFQQAGFPKGVVNVVFGDRDEARTLVLANIDRVVFTGSVSGGQAIMEIASKRLHPLTLELGGKHPAIVLEDADIERIAQPIIWSAFTNAGQACASIERLYVVRPVAERLSRRLAELASKLRLGNGLSPDIDVGPVIDGQQLERIASQVNEAVAQGATLLAGGHKRWDLTGYFFEPTVLGEVTQQMRVIREETFGPVLPIVVVDNEEEAIALANDSTLGLAASVWTSDLQRGEAIARRLQAGVVWINDALYSHGCPGAPWGGIKNSGFGRTHSAFELLDFVYVKHIGVDWPDRKEWHYPYSRERLCVLARAMEACHAQGIVTKVKSLVSLIPDWLKIHKD